MEKRLFTSESVTEGHPDKVCDAISDAILDACMAEDPMSRVACETASCTGFVLVTGEITTKAQLDIPAIVRKTVNEIGYNDAKTGFDGNTCAVMVALDQQSPDIAMGVDKALEAKEGALTDNLDTGAGDQGMMFGYATNETPELMPYPISLAHKLALQLTKVRKDGTLTYLRPDGKTQVSVEYDEAGKPVRLEAVVLSTQHDDDVTQEQIHADIKKYVFDPILPKEMIDAETKFFINPTGRRPHSRQSAPSQRSRQSAPALRRLQKLRPARGSTVISARRWISVQRQLQPSSIGKAGLSERWVHGIRSPCSERMSSAGWKLLWREKQINLRQSSGRQCRACLQSWQNTQEKVQRPLRQLSLPEIRRCCIS